MIKINNYLKPWRIEADVEFIVPEGPHNEMMAAGFPWPQFMTPQWIAIVNEEILSCFFKIWVLLCRDANEADNFLWKHRQEVHTVIYFRMTLYQPILQSQTENCQNFLKSKKGHELAKNNTT